MLNNAFFDQDALIVAKNLLGKIIYRKLNGLWLKVRIIETEAYYKAEKGSHSSLGFTQSRRAMFMPAGTIYMYYSRGRDSLNISVHGDGNGVLIKSGVPYFQATDYQELELNLMRAQYHDQTRDIKKLCNGQTLLCQALNIKVKDWNAKMFNKGEFYIKDEQLQPREIIQTTRLGIPQGRDENLPYRFIDRDFVKWCTKPIRI
jgi:DNA-3-methyladenine glycosylase